MYAAIINVIIKNSENPLEPGRESDAYDLLDLQSWPLYTGLFVYKFLNIIIIDQVYVQVGSNVFIYLQHQCVGHKHIYVLWVMPVIGEQVQPGFEGNILHDLLYIVHGHISAHLVQHMFAAIYPISAYG